MKSYGWNCRKDTENINSRVSKASNNGTMILWKNQNSRFIKNQEAKGILSNLGIKTPLKKITILGDILF